MSLIEIDLTQVSFLKFVSSCSLCKAPCVLYLNLVIVFKLGPPYFEEEAAISYLSQTLRCEVTVAVVTPRNRICSVRVGTEWMSLRTRQNQESLGPKPRMCLFQKCLRRNLTQQHPSWKRPSAKMNGSILICRTCSLYSWLTLVCYVAYFNKDHTPPVETECACTISAYSNINGEK